MASSSSSSSFLLYLWLVISVQGITLSESKVWGSRQKLAILYVINMGEKMFFSRLTYEIATFFFFLLRHKKKTRHMHSVNICFVLRSLFKRFGSISAATEQRHKKWASINENIKIIWKIAIFCYFPFSLSNFHLISVQDIRPLIL